MLPHCSFTPGKPLPSSRKQCCFVLIQPHHNIQRAAKNVLRLRFGKVGPKPMLIALCFQSIVTDGGGNIFPLECCHIVSLNLPTKHLKSPRPYWLALLPPQHTIESPNDSHSIFLEMKMPTDCWVLPEHTDTCWW